MLNVIGNKGILWKIAKPKFKKITLSGRHTNVPD
jgi:hypothetical protein